MGESKAPFRLPPARPVLLDGATGTELERRGVHTGLPLWSAHALLDAPEQVEAVHRDYVACGVEIVTANTFRTQRRALAKGGIGERAGELTALAVRLARRAADSAEGVWVAGSVPPLEDCYRPELVPGDAELAGEHAEHVHHLVEAGADLLLVETMNTIREARAAAQAAGRSGLPLLVSFVTDARAHLLSGEPLAQALASVRDCAPLAVGVNCLPPSAVGPCLAVLREAGLPFGVYANLGAPNDQTGFTRAEDCTPAVFADLAMGWCQRGARFIGGCCGTTPAHLGALAERLAASPEPG